MLLYTLLGKIFDRLKYFSYLISRNRRTLNERIFFSIIFVMFCLTLSYLLFSERSKSFPLHFLLSQMKKENCLKKNFIDDLSLLNSPYKIPLHLTFSIDTVYHQNGIAYDYYSIPDLQQNQPACQWEIWPLTDQINTSPSNQSKLPFVDIIYLITDPTLTERHSNLQKAFDRQGISMDSVEWRMKWNYTTCNSNSSHTYIYQRFNLKEKPLNIQQQRRCALAMKHLDVWYQMAEENIGLGLIIEDDVIFVPFFKEKFIRMIYAAINEGILNLNGSCIKSKENPISNNERIDQNPMIVIGSCFNFHDQSFQSELLNPPPLLSTHKSNPSRCSHAYLLTSCSAKSLIDQIQFEKNDFNPSDFLQNYLFNLSSTLQSFWMDPPLAYQGNQVIDLDHLDTFKRSTY